jgi:hypothetical protein
MPFTSHVAQAAGREGKTFKSEQSIAGEENFSSWAKLPTMTHAPLETGLKCAGFLDRSFKFGAASALSRWKTFPLT